MKTLYDYLLEMKDFRRAQGKRISLAAFLEMSVLAGMSGHFGINSISRFIKNNETFFIERYNLLHGVPSKTTVFKMLRDLPFDNFSAVLRNWMFQFVESNSDLWIAIDGKAIGSTLVNKNDSKQNFKSMVSLFSKKAGVILDAVSIETKKENEGQAARDLIAQFESKGMTFTMDALHCQKKQSAVSWSQEMIM
jgi:hypothetical protein